MVGQGNVEHLYRGTGNQRRKGGRKRRSKKSRGGARTSGGKRGARAIRGHAEEGEKVRARKKKGNELEKPATLLGNQLSPETGGCWRRRGGGNFEGTSIPAQTRQLAKKEKKKKKKKGQKK